MDFTNIKDAQGVLYVPNLPWLELSGHALIAKLAEARAALNDDTGDEAGWAAELERLEALFEDHMKVRLLPMTHSEYKAARSASKAVRHSIDFTKGSVLNLGDQLAKETDFAIELIGKRVAKVYKLNLVGLVDGKRDEVTTGPQLEEAIRTKLSEGHAAAIIEDLHLALKSISHLEKGLGEASPSQSAS